MLEKNRTERRIQIASFFILLFYLSLYSNTGMMKKTPKIQVHVKNTIQRLIDEEDVDQDLKITIDDHFDGEHHGDKQFLITTVDQKCYEVRGNYYLANLLQELKLALDRGEVICELDFQRIFEDPVQRFSRQIRTLFWDGLTRKIELHNLPGVIADEKVKSDGLNLYIPFSDKTASNYFKTHKDNLHAQNIQIRVLPPEITPKAVQSLEGRHGLLILDSVMDSSGEILGKPYVVPGGRFNEMYGWDSYFIVLGLLTDGRVDLAKCMVDHHVYQINHYGKILNANRTYYLTRSQPPFLSSMARAVYNEMSKTSESKAWMKQVCQAIIREYQQVWMHPKRLTGTGLSRYFGEGLGPPVEVESGHFDAIYQPYAQSLGMLVRKFERQYKEGKVLQSELDQFFVHDRAVRESGHDTTYRWWAGGKDRCADFVPVDLNALLYKTEIDMAFFIDHLFEGTLVMPGGSEETGAAWKKLADNRKKSIRQYFWNEADALFYDYNFVDEYSHPYISATAFYPLWACDPDRPDTRILTDTEADRLIRCLLNYLEFPGGLAASSEKSRGPVSELRPQRQWDYPHGWAPHQMIAWQALCNYHHDSHAQRLIYRWLYTIIRNAVDYNGTIPEKFNVVTRSHQVFAEYGNVGTKFAYITREGFGWMNASYQVGLKLLKEDLHDELNQMIPPEWLFEDQS
ncbi:trehalase [bacterium]|nr:trehalase [bacterium]